MAEGGHHPLGDEIPECPKWNWLHGSLEYVFASDFVHFVIEHRDRSWRYRRLMGHSSPITPFNTAIQDVVEKVLRRDSFYLERMFSQLVEQYDKLTHARFNLCAAIIKEVYFGRFDAHWELLKYFCIVGHFSVWALKRNLDSAPYLALDIILRYMKDFLILRDLNNMDDFWFDLEREAESALNLGDVTLIRDNTLQHIRNWQRRAEELCEGSSSAENAGATEGENSAETSAKGGPPLEQFEEALDETIEVEKSELEGASSVPPEGATSVSEVVPTPPCSTSGSPPPAPCSTSGSPPPAPGSTSGSPPPATGSTSGSPPPAPGSASGSPPPATGSASGSPPPEAVKPILKVSPSPPTTGDATAISEVLPPPEVAQPILNVTLPPGSTSGSPRPPPGSTTGSAPPPSKSTKNETKNETNNPKKVKKQTKQR